MSMRYMNIVELDAPASYLVKISNSVDWRTITTYTHPLTADITLAATHAAVLDTCLPIIQYHYQALLESKQTWQVILDGQLINGYTQ